MKKFAVVFFGAALFTGCVESGTGDADKTAIDRVALENGLSVAVGDEIGTVSLSFTGPIADATAEELSAAVGASTSLVVRNNASGATTNLLDGLWISSVDSTPTSAGEFAITLNEARDAALVTFFNETALGQSLYVGGDYTAMLSVADNDYVENFSATAVDLTVVEL